jgi:hypothetical protein
MGKRNAGGGGLLRFLFSIILLAAAAVAVIYFFFPDISEEYFSMSWDSSRNGSLSGAETEAVLDEVIDALSSALEKAGASAEDVRKIISSIDGSDLRRSVENAVAGGRDGAAQFADTLVRTIDLEALDLKESINLDSVKEGLQKKLSEMDFSESLSLLKNNLETGLEYLAERLKESIN